MTQLTMGYGTEVKCTRCQAMYMRNDFNIDLKLCQKCTHEFLTIEDHHKTKVDALKRALRGT